MLSITMSMQQGPCLKREDRRGSGSQVGVEDEFERLCNQLSETKTYSILNKYLKNSNL